MMQASGGGKERREGNLRSWEVEGEDKVEKTGMSLADCFQRRENVPKCKYPSVHQRMIGSDRPCKALPYLAEGNVLDALIYPRSWQEGVVYGQIW
jgi:hypothetical protein